MYSSVPNYDSDEEEMMDSPYSDEMRAPRIGPAIRYVYKYYQSDGATAYLSSVLLDIIRPTCTWAIIYWIMTLILQNYFPESQQNIPYSDYMLISSIIPAIDVLVTLIIMGKKLPNIARASDLFAKIGVPDDFMKCARSTEIAHKLASADYINHEFEFFGMALASDHILIDLADSGTMQQNICTHELNILKKVICRSLNGSSTMATFLLYIIRSLLMWPFSIIIGAFSWVISHAHYLKDQPGFIIARSWSPWATYKYRYYYETENETDIRLMSAEMLAKEYLSEFPSPILEAFSEWIQWMLGIIALVTLIVSADIRILSVTLVLWAVAKSFAKKKGKVYRPLRVWQDLVNLVNLTSPKDDSVSEYIKARERLLDVFPRKCSMMLSDMLYVLLGPISIIKTLYTYSSVITSQIDKNIVRSNDYYIHRSCIPGNMGTFNEDKMLASIMEYSRVNEDMYQSMVVSKRFAGNYV